MKRFKKILLGIDLNHFSKEAMEFAAETAKLRHSKLIVMYVHRSPLKNIAVSKNTTQKEIEKYKSELIKLCEKYISKSVNWEAVVLEGRPIYQTIIRAAKKLQSDLIIVGEHDRHQLDEILLGSNAEKIVRYAPCSVFVLRQI
ncbi:universal stress protein [bacterium]|nr:universal stress protein [bacterium]